MDSPRHTQHTSACLGQTAYEDLTPEVLFLNRTMKIELGVMSQVDTPCWRTAQPLADC